MTFPQLSTARLLLRQLIPADTANMFILRTDEQVNKYLNRPKPKDLAEVQAFIEKINKSVSENESLFWAICRHENPEMIGTICFWNFSDDRKITEVGYSMLPNYQGQGFMTEALDCVLTYASQNLELDAVLAYTHVENTASSRLLVKRGFVLDTGFGLTDDFHQKYRLSSI